ncbi:MAG: TetR/AcrR family transcriptional regulator [Actinobacteria bacterium]|nr:TetR/AcrR family transcriptional regulator [Actinomycetota bacterium]MBV8958948.1 TetR/AcrR family transcriptional regulator [Actinomycetota bacterium]MBV9252998.1 TetR/AcrR family transcriptional regulator [Actinomycetota bacterium]MBV9662743.1 TetR/AcrR family transcriptional regulator [Actinomycetota bacterium]MBV9935236.1 TetR/AcrR family transcriptional regulator [Actinomycetota bacterium]
MTRGQPSHLGDGPRGKAIREKVAKKVAATLEKEAARQERYAHQAAKAAEALDRIESRLSSLDVWLRHEPASRRPRFTRDEIAATAIRIADAEGFDAVSMRRLAAELDAGTMTLYHYIQTKDELLTLVTDAVMAEVVIPDDVEMPSDWREAITMVASRSLAAMRRHPWFMSIADDPPLGPNSVRHIDQTLQAVSSLPISLAEKFEIVMAVDEYAFGFAMSERSHANAPDWPRADMVAYVDGLVRSGNYPQLQALSEELGLEPMWTQVNACVRDPDRFARCLARLLEGIEIDLQARGVKTG